MVIIFNKSEVPSKVEVEPPNVRSDVGILDEQHGDVGGAAGTGGARSGRIARSEERAA